MKLIASVLAISTMLVGCNFNDTGHPNPPPPVDDTAGGTRALPRGDSSALPRGDSSALPRGDPRALPQGRTPDAPAAARHGMTTGQKVVMLGGAAALYYLYKHHQSAAAQPGPEGQYYLSKNGRVYYRDADHRAHWVTPPQEGIAVPESEARDYQQFQGYENKQDGKDLTGLGSDSSQ